MEPLDRLRVTNADDIIVLGRELLQLAVPIVAVELMEGEKEKGKEKYPLATNTSL